MRRRRPLRLLTLMAATALMVGGCGLQGSDPAPEETDEQATTAPEEEDENGEEPESTEPPEIALLPEIGESSAVDLAADPAEDPAYAEFYDQDLSWEPCTDYNQADCAVLDVPLAWDDPSEQTIQLTLLRYSATGESEGTLFVNPGGPGGSGVDFIGQAKDYLFSEDVLAEYDIVGFDPRGVGRSTPVECLDDPQTDDMRAATYDLDTQEGRDQSTSWGERIAAACEENSGPHLPYLDTWSAARDLDVMRAVVGSEKLDYLGYSYGTYLGASYAELYPGRTGTFVLDGAMDPSL
ncbi:MAG: alpha/beta fold hydrolase, partial [Brachybacterium sp.]|nr:alpha/beta fold hydrolase [Brachybacterium sp.]